MTEMVFISGIVLHTNQTEGRTWVEAFHQEMGSDLQHDDETAGEIESIELEGFEGLVLPAVTGVRWEAGSDPHDALQEWINDRAPRQPGLPWVVMLRPDTTSKENPDNDPTVDDTWAWAWDGDKLELHSYRPHSLVVEQGVFPKFPGYENVLRVLESTKKAARLEDQWPQITAPSSKPRM